MLRRATMAQKKEGTTTLIPSPCAMCYDALRCATTLYRCISPCIIAVSYFQNIHNYYGCWCVFTSYPCISLCSVASAHLPSCFRFAFPCFVCYYMLLLYTMSVLFSRLWSIWRVLVQLIAWYAVFFAFAIPALAIPWVSTFPMRYDAICYGAMTILRRSTTCYGVLMRQRATELVWKHSFHVH